ncbi:hypothetical protein A2773_05840 [Candidatus Gottesmanbacteria bacterium RIFCSPHIGHO2_01_FULL_39_10]|uniref:Sulfatase N-terminal domain-containing protein n=1 Tax=Candidatus Gottesmanbacteria bacterium RIFCSPHIGHO2_01_FULL_39_10 TaxID=1798375 RepID=A0A1F5ZKT6_9BACT|nr:MAG: hypothetical protein A2773_05840 [Candidatus Gottesmanbacteria bacterium RIFCSPHIGHO2_01_FULL_39_10]
MIAPILFTLSFILSLYQKNIGELTPKSLILPLVSGFIFSLVILFLSRFLFKIKSKAIVFSIFFLTLFFFYGQILSIIPVRANLFIVELAILILAFILLQQSKYKFTSLVSYLRILSIILVIFPLIGIIKYEFFERKSSLVMSPQSLPEVQRDKLPQNLPDIYYIVPDSFSGEHVFNKYFQHDISGFTRFLQNKGFYIAQDSAANYPKTFLSLASSLNMKYLDYLSKYQNSSDQTIVAPLIENNLVMRFLKSQGYKYYQMGSWWGPSSFNRYADDNYTVRKQNNLGLDEFSHLILTTTMIHPLWEAISPKEIIGESDEDKRSIVLYQFETLPKVAKLPGPKFVFVHIIAPHAPYVFDKNCNFTTQDVTDAQPVEVKYANQTQCISKKLENTITSILSSSQTPPVILLETDEGARFVAEMLDPDDSWEKASDKIIRMKFPILAAYYLPGVSRDKLYPGISPVNSFRIILNLYFGTKLPLLPDRVYVFPNMQNLYRFRDVTDIVKNDK